MKRSVVGIVLFSGMMFFLSMIVLGTILSGSVEPYLLRAIVLCALLFAAVGLFIALRDSKK